MGTHPIDRPALADIAVEDVVAVARVAFQTTRPSSMRRLRGHWIYRKHDPEEYMADGYSQRRAEQLASACVGLGIPCHMVF